MLIIKHVQYMAFIGYEEIISIVLSYYMKYMYKNE